MMCAGTISAAVRFVSPQQGGQAVGVQIIEISTDLQNVDRAEFRVDGVLIGVARTAPFRVAYDFGSDVSSRTIAAKVINNGYRNNEVATITTTALTAGESINVDVVEVPLRVRSSRSLKPNDLRVRENSVDQTISEIRAGRGPAHFAFVIDRSLSMGEGRLTAALRAVDAARSMLRPDDSASLILFNHNVSRARPLTERDTALDLTTDITPSGGTSLRDAVSSSVTNSTVTARRTYAIVISDGGDRNSAMSEEQALRKISGTKTVVAAIVLGDAGTFLRNAAKNTGGALVNTSVESLPRDLRTVMSDINSRYTLVYQSRGTKSGWRTISVTSRRNGIEILNARKGYFAG